MSRDSGKDSGATMLSMSVEETNKIRLAAGLKPLAVEDPQEATRRAEEQERQKLDVVNEQQAQQLREELAKRKKKRLLHGVIAGPSLGQLLGNTVAGNAAEWVEANRQKKPKGEEIKAAQKRAKSYQEQEEQFQDYDKEQLKGMKVAHELDKLMEGESAILTLKDDTVLKKDQSGKYDINKDEDQLENIDMAQTIKREKAKEMSKKLRYDVYDDKPTSILSNYDEPEEEKGFRLGEEAQKEQVKSQLAEQENKRVYDLSSEKKIASDYLRPDEMIKIKKRKAKQSGHNKRVKTESLADILAEPEESSTISSDRGSRNDVRRQRMETDKTELEQRARDEAYLNALHKSQQQAKQLEAKERGIQLPPVEISAPTITVKKEVVEDTPEEVSVKLKLQQMKTKPVIHVKPLTDDIQSILDEDDDAELRAVLDKARLLAAEKKRFNDMEIEGSSSASASLAAKKGNNDSKEKEAEEEEEEEADVGRRLAKAIRAQRKPEITPDSRVKQEPQENQIVFTATTEFCRGLEVSDARAYSSSSRRLKNEGNGIQVKKEHDKDEIQGNGGEPVESVTVKSEEQDDNMEESSPRHQKQKKHKLEPDGHANGEERNEDNSRDSENSDDDDEQADLAFMQEENLGSVSSALRLAQRRGLLVQARRDHSVFESDTGNIQLDRIGKDGHMLTAKEAFKEMSHAFHGRLPGKAKTEKRMKKQQEELFARKSASSATMNKLKDVQRKTGQAYLVLEQKQVNVDPKQQTREPTRLTGGQTNASASAKGAYQAGAKKVEFGLGKKPTKTEPT